MARNKIVQGDRVAAELRQLDKPFATTQDLAKALDVSAQAIRNNESELAEHSELCTGKVARATVYWLHDSGRPQDLATANVPAPPRSGQKEKGWLERLGLKRAQLGGNIRRGFLDRYQVHPVHTILIVAGFVAANISLGALIYSALATPPGWVSWAIFYGGLTVLCFLWTAVPVGHLLYKQIQVWQAMDESKQSLGEGVEQ